MQEIQYRGSRGEIITDRELFSAPTMTQCFDNMRARLAELETQHEIISMKREKVGRNQPCPCGSNIKFKKCCIDKVK